VDVTSHIRNDIVLVIVPSRCDRANVLTYISDFSRAKIPKYNLRAVSLEDSVSPGQARGVQFLEGTEDRA
jgi:hypothetical protein